MRKIEFIDADSVFSGNVAQAKDYQILALLKQILIVFIHKQSLEADVSP